MPNLLRDPMISTKSTFSQSLTLRTPPLFSGGDHQHHMHALFSVLSSQAFATDSYARTDGAEAAEDRAEQSSTKVSDKDITSSEPPWEGCHQPVLAHLSSLSHRGVVVSESIEAT